MSHDISDDDLADLGEPLFDELSKDLLQRFAGEALPELAAEIPGIKLGIVIGKLFGKGKDYLRTKMLMAFLLGLENGSESIDKFEEKSEEDKAFLRGLIVSQLDMIADERQAVAIAYAINSYLYGRIDKPTLLGLLYSIRATNPLIFYYRDDGIAPKDGREPDSESGNQSDYGKAHHKAAIAFTMEVYRPMCEKYNL